MAEAIIEERRALPRMRTLKRGRIVVGLNSTFNCTIRNLSETGSRLELPSVAGVPDHFELEISGHRRVKARVAWKTFTAMGVAFVD